MLEGRFWGEEGTIYFLDALVHGLYSFGNAHLGYYSLWNKIAAYAATFVPLENSPLVTVYFAFLIQYAIILIAWKSDIFQTVFQKLAAIAVMFLAFPSNELWMNTINSQFYFALGTAIILASGTASFQPLARRSFLLMAGLTGAVSLFLVPFFALRAILQRDRSRAVDTGVLVGCGLIQGLTYVLTIRDRSMTPDVGMALADTGIYLGFMPYAGIPVTNAVLQGLQAMPWSAISFGLLCLAIGLGIAWIACRQVAKAWWLALSAIWLCVLCHLGAIGGLPLETLSPTMAGRYGYASVALFGLMLVAAMPTLSNLRSIWRRDGLDRNPPVVRRDDLSATHPTVTSKSSNKKILFGEPSKHHLITSGQLLVLILLLLFTLNGAFHFIADREYLEGPNWREAIAAWRQDPSVTHVPVWPQRMTFEIPRDAPL